MTQDHRIALWKEEEAIAHIHGWDFSHIDGRYTEEEDLPYMHHKEHQMVRSPHSLL